MGLETPKSKETIEQRNMAEDLMDRNQMTLSEVREEVYENVFKRSGLEPEVFDEIVNSFDYKIEDGTTEISFKARGHEVTRVSNQGVYEPYVVDGEVATSVETDLIDKKYGKVIQELKFFDKEQMQTMRERYASSGVLDLLR